MDAGYDFPMKPRLVYDGDCAFCRYTVEYAASVTSDAVEYRPYQEVMSEYPDITEAEFADSIQLFADGERYQRADAAFRTLAIGGVRFWDRLYRRLPGFARLSDALYRWVARHRQLCLSLARPAVRPGTASGRIQRHSRSRHPRNRALWTVRLPVVVVAVGRADRLAGSAPGNRLFRSARGRVRARNVSGSCRHCSGSMPRPWPCTWYARSARSRR